MMKECGYPCNALALPRFMKEAIKPKQTGQLKGTFKIPSVPAYGVLGSDRDEVWVKAAIPFRLYKGDSVLKSDKLNGVKGAALVTVNRSLRGDMWFMTKEKRLMKCRFDSFDAQTVIDRGGILYQGESSASYLVFGRVISSDYRDQLKNLDTAFNRFAKETNDNFVIDIEIERLTYGHALEWQDSWGYYRRDALIDNDLDSDYLMNWNSTGALTGMTPDYFRPQESPNPVVVSAKLVSATLRTKDGDVIASYRRR
jgi:hypothetical protein